MIKLTCSFSPRGEHWLKASNRRLLLKRYGINGLAINVRGVLLDKDDKQICAFESSHLGMGYFILHPEKDNVYKAKLSFDDGPKI